MLPEISKPIPGFDGYVISESGVIVGPYKKPLRPAQRKDGYQSVVLRINGKSVTKKIHYLVAITFVGARPDGLECRHLDGNKANNHWKNLQWATHAENMADNVKFAANAGENNGRATISQEQADSIKRRLALNEEVGAIASDMNISAKIVSHIKGGRRWTERSAA